MTLKRRLGFSWFWVPSLLVTSLILAPGVRADEFPSEIIQQETSQLGATEEFPSEIAQQDLEQLRPGEFSVNLGGGILNNNLSELFNRAFHHNTGRFFEINDILGQVNNIFGARTFPGSFLDNQIARDGELVETLFYYFLNEEMAKPSIRTQDLPSPFTTSIQEDPSYLNSR